MWRGGGGDKKSISQRLVIKSKTLKSTFVTMPSDKDLPITDGIADSSSSISCLSDSVEEKSPMSLISTLIESNLLIQIDTDHSRQISGKLVVSTDPPIIASESGDWPQNSETTTFRSFPLERIETPQKQFGVVPKNCQPTDNQMAKVANIFDTHCHIDRLFALLFEIEGNDFYNPNSYKMKKILSRQYNTKGPMELLRKMKYKAHGYKFEGCINVVCDPKFFEKKFWEWLTFEKDVWFTLGCHPKFSGRYV
jgi:hypothetical protein